MSNQGGGLPGQTTQPMVGAVPNPAGVAIGGAAMTQQQQLFFQNMAFYNSLAQQGKITPQLLASNPALNMIHNMMQQQKNAAAAAGIRPGMPGAMMLPGMVGAPGGIPTLPTAPGTLPVFGQQTVIPPAPAVTGGQTSGRKRKADHHRLPDRTYDYFPESPMFVSLQDTERRIDALLNRKRAALTELAASAKRVIEGRAVGDTPGSARKRLRIYIFSQHFHQPSENKPPPKAGEPEEPPSWVLKITGRVLDPDACHPGGGGDPEPPEDAHSSRHRFTYYLKRLEVRLDTEDGPLQAPDDVAPANGTGGNVVIWEKSRMDHEARNSFEIHRQGSTPVRATITFELDHQPELYTVSSVLESLLGLQTGEGGAPGLYSQNHLASKVWQYGRVNNLVVNTINGPTMLPSEPLLKACNMPGEQILELVLTNKPMDAGDIQDLVKGAVSAPEPLILQHTIPVDGPEISPMTCLDLHLEVPLEFSEGTTKEFADLMKAREALEKELDTLDHVLANCWHKFRDHKRRHTLLSAFSEDPVGSIREMIMAQGKELRTAAGKEMEAVEILKSSDVYGDKWTQDAILKYLAKKAAAPSAVPHLVVQSAHAIMQQQQRQTIAQAYAVQMAQQGMLPQSVAVTALPVQPGGVAGQPAAAPQGGAAPAPAPVQQ